MEIWRNLTNLQLDALKEIGNIGAGNAASALATMLGRKIYMEVPWAGVLDLKEMMGRVGKEEDLVVCVNTVISGEAPGEVLLVLDAEDAFHLTDLLLGKPLGTTQALDEMVRSVLEELGNILTGSFLNAFSTLTQLTFFPSLPAFAFDMLGAVLSAALLEKGYFADQILIVETRFWGAQADKSDTSIKAYFFLVPEAHALVKILKALGLDTENLKEEGSNGEKGAYCR